MDRIILKLFETKLVDVNLVKLIREFAGGDDVDAFVNNIIRHSTGHSTIFGVQFKFKLGGSTCTVVSKYDNTKITLELRSRKFHKLRCESQCNRNDILDFDDWVIKQNDYYNMCESFLYFIVRRYRDGLTQCNVCDKHHWCDYYNTCQTCLSHYNKTPCPKCLSYFGRQPHKH